MKILLSYWWAYNDPCQSRWKGPQWFQRNLVWHLYCNTLSEISAVSQTLKTNLFMSKPKLSYFYKDSKTRKHQLKPAKPLPRLITDRHILSASITMNSLGRWIHLNRTLAWPSQANLVATSYSDCSPELREQNTLACSGVIDGKHTRRRGIDREN